MIRVSIAQGSGQAPPALFVRRSEDMATITPAPASGVDKIYAGSIVFPSTPGAEIYLTVTIGDATGCFSTHL
ncbi:hypothetical protein N566_02800 [Streptomycetaceae bacterium MP113-05]|nr:hypothetical protein N566_02800 [Streptomycetaceae bacterium MP113-05]